MSIYTYSARHRSMLLEADIRSYVRQSILLEYNDTLRVRSLNEGIFDFFTGLADGAFGGIKNTVGKAVVDMLKIEPKGIGAKAITQFFKKTGIKDIANIVMGKGGCKETLVKFSTTLIDLVVKDIPRTLGLDPKGEFTLKLQGVFGEPAKEMAEKVAEALCNLSWSDILSVVPGINMILKYLPGGDKEGDKVPEAVVDDAGSISA